MTLHSHMPAPRPNQNQYHHLVDAMKGNFARPADTPSNMTTYYGLWERTTTKDELADASRKAQLKNHLNYLNPLNPDPFIPTPPPLIARSAMLCTSNIIAQNTLASIAGPLPWDTGPIDARKRPSRNTGGRRQQKGTRIKNLLTLGTIVTDSTISLEKKMVTLMENADSLIEPHLRLLSPPSLRSHSI